MYRNYICTTWKVVSLRKPQSHLKSRFIEGSVLGVMRMARPVHGPPVRFHVLEDCVLIFHFWASDSNTITKRKWVQQQRLIKTEDMRMLASCAMIIIFSELYSMVTFFWVYDYWCLSLLKQIETPNTEKSAQKPNLINWRGGRENYLLVLLV